MPIMNLDKDTGETGRFVMYHHLNGAQTFEEGPGNPTRQSLAEQGWCDSPMKAGIPRSTDPGEVAAAQEMRQRVLDKKIPPLDRDDDDGPQQDLSAELENLKRMVAEQAATINELRTDANRSPMEQVFQEHAEGLEKQADEKADAARKVEGQKPKGRPLKAKKEAEPAADLV